MMGMPCHERTKRNQKDKNTKQRQDYQDAKCRICQLTPLEIWSKLQTTFRFD